MHSDWFQAMTKPSQLGLSQKELDDLRQWVAKETSGTPYGCLIIKQDHIVAEWYGGGFGCQSLFEIGSIRKSFNSALIGIGTQAGTVDLNARAVDWWPDIVSISGDEADAAITLHQLASGTSGWLTPDPPGSVFRYNNAAFTAAERVVARMYDLPNDEIAPEVLRRFNEPLHAESWRVYHFGRDFTPQNYGNPGPKLAIDSNLRDLLKWGYVWLRRGVWRDKELIPADYIHRATRPTNPHLSYAPYGYNWFVNTGGNLWPGAPRDSYGHRGAGTFKPSEARSSVYLWICPSLDMVAAVVLDAETRFAEDFLENTGTFQWITRVASIVENS